MKNIVLRLVCVALAIAWRYWFRVFPMVHVLVTAEEFWEFANGKSGKSFAWKDDGDAETE